jgi:uncharacterized protein
MPGEMSLTSLLRDMQPVLRPAHYVFCTQQDASYGAFPETKPLATISEKEGLTLVLTKEDAERAGLAYDAAFRCITLQVHSSLEAVGLTAAVAQTLAAHGISANLLAGYHHDHLLVPQGEAEKALKLLRALSAQARPPSEPS